jgi:hypothetical protein
VCEGANENLSPYEARSQLGALIFDPHVKVLGATFENCPKSALTTGLTGLCLRKGATLARDWLVDDMLAALFVKRVVVTGLVTKLGLRRPQ